MIKSKMVVVDEFKLTRRDGKFVQEGRKQIRKGAVVTRAYAEQVIEDSGNCRHFEIDEDATVDYYEQSKQQIEQRRINAEAGKVKANDIANALVGAIGTQAPAPAPAPAPAQKVALFPDGKPNDNWGEGELKAWLTGNKVEFDSRIGRAKLLQFAKECIKNGTIKIEE